MGYTVSHLLKYSYPKSIRLAVGSILATVALTGLSSCSQFSSTDSADTNASDSQTNTTVPSPERLVAHVVDTHPFNPESFTQGLEVDENGELLVGTGHYGKSRIYRADIETHKESASSRMDIDHFGEGITLHGDTVWQLTWKAGEAIKRDARSLKEKDRATYSGEGWGLCAFDDVLWRSDGTSELTSHDPETFSRKSHFTVTVDGQEIDQLNELECVSHNGEKYILANVWFSTDIYKIDPATGEVTAIIDASSLKNNAADDHNNALNGIAHIPGTDRFLMTGKRWPDLYEVELR